MWSHAWPGPNPTSVGTATSCLDLGMPPCFSGIGVGGTTSLATTPIVVSVSNNGSFQQHMTQRVLLFSSLHFYGICKELKTWKLTWQSKCKRERLLWLRPGGGPGLLVLKVQSLPSLKFSELFICASVEWLNTFLHISGLAWDGLSGTSVHRCPVSGEMARMSFKSHTSSSFVCILSGMLQNRRWLLMDRNQGPFHSTETAEMPALNTLEWKVCCRVTLTSRCGERKVWKWRPLAYTMEWDLTVDSGFFF